MDTNQLKEQARKEFEANFLDGDKIDDCGKTTITVDKEFIDFIDSLIDRTVQMTEERWQNQPANEHDEKIRQYERERIARKRDIIWDLLCKMDTNIKSEKEYADEIISPITNKSDLSGN